MNLSVLRSVWSLVLMFPVVASGCGSEGPELGRVNGTVLLDGKPVPAAFVVFTPHGNGRPAQAKTNQDGRFTLAFTAARAGAIVGKHNVTVSTADLTDDNKVIPEIIPAKYHKSGSVEVEVKSGSNDVVLDLKSR